MNPFDTEASRYDEWFDSPDGQVIFALEVACLRGLLRKTVGRWLEVGVGTGRFAQALGIREGIDPSSAVLAYASSRGIRTQLGYGENLPYSENSFDGVLMVVTICFLAGPEKAFEECRRVLKEGGRLIVGLVPADSAWGELYAKKGYKGHHFYSVARFYTCDQVVSIANAAGFTFDSARSCLFTPPSGPVTDLSIREEVVTNAGFVALQFTRGNKKTEKEDR
ncbi:MAG: class I SAM-dependent methyltransferase [Deltaproteobacteria bacterium]|nr:class I SAM-dependent methyltransferase [Deltaproteobacteria bacterium]